MSRSILWAGLISCLCSASVQAADHELSVELGTLNNSDRAFNTFSESPAMVSWGVRAGFAVHNRLAIISSYHRSRRGNDVRTGDEEAFLLRAAYFSDQLSVGAKADLEVTEWLYPYATVQGIVYHATIKLDDDPEDRNNPGQLKASGWSGGGMGTVGVEFRIPTVKRVPFQLAAHLEGGYALIARHGYNSIKTPSLSESPEWGDSESLGTMQPGGFIFRLGLGLRL